MIRLRSVGALVSYLLTFVYFVQASACNDSSYKLYYHHANDKALNSCRAAAADDDDDNDDTTGTR